MEKIEKEEIIKKHKLNPTRTLVIGIVLIIFIGAIILSLPISNNKPIKFIDALFVSTTSVCVTGLTTVVIAEQFTLFRTSSNYAFNTNWWFRINELFSFVINANGQKSKFIRQNNSTRIVKSK